MDNRLPAHLLATASKSRFSMGRPLAATVVLKMKSTASALFLGIAVVGLTISPSANAVPIVYDLAADWSDISNPNGVWSYLVNGAIAASGTRTGDTFGTPQPIWGAGFTGWSQSNGTEGFPHDWSVGDVFGHTPTNLAALPSRGPAPTTGRSVLLEGSGKVATSVAAMSGR